MYCIERKFSTTPTLWVNLVPRPAARSLGIRLLMGSGKEAETLDHDGA